MVVASHKHKHKQVSIPLKIIRFAWITIETLIFCPVMFYCKRLKSDIGFTPENLLLFLRTLVRQDFPLLWDDWNQSKANNHFEGPTENRVKINQSAISGSLLTTALYVQVAGKKPLLKKNHITAHLELASKWPA